MKHDNILVTGGAGFIGSHLAARLLEQGRRVTVVDNLSNGRISNVPAGAEFMEADLTDSTSLNAIDPAGFDAVFHLAAQSSGAVSFRDPMADMKSHVQATLNVLDWCFSGKVRRFMYSSSTTVYGDPDTLPVREDHEPRPKMYYSAGKLASEDYVRFFSGRGMDTTVFRLPNVYGPGQNLDNRFQGMISIYLSFMLSGEPVTVMGSGKRFRDFLYIDDLVDAWMLALDNDDTFGQTFNLATGRKTTVVDILNLLKKHFGNDDYPVEFVEGTPGDQIGMYCDISKIEKVLGWQPKVDVTQGIARLMELEKRRSTSA